MANLPSTLSVPDRRQRFRAFMKRFNPTAPAKAAIGEGLIYQSPGRSIFRKLAAAADLTPGSQQLLTGGIGSGKTTELLMAQDELVSHGAMPVYIDISAETDLSALNSGALLASLGIRLGEIIRSKFDWSQGLAEAYGAIQKAAYGYQREAWVPDDEYAYPEPYDRQNYEPGRYQTIHVPGKIKPTFPALRRDVQDLAQPVSKLTGFLKEQKIDVVAIFDGLDRLIQMDKFWLVAEQDLRALRPLEISVLAAGPLSILYGRGREVKDYFDEVHYLPPAVADPRVSPFLLEVLLLRGAGELMNRDQMQKLCLASGGVLRDLISLGRGAGENAYLDDLDAIEDKHVDRSIEQLASSYLLGLGTRQNAILLKLLDGGSFTPSDPENMELLITRRVLERPESRYEVHPALATLLQHTAKGDS
ncbi:MAG TPA: hypothetical protein VME43_01590 [Bryobacteraceae bacterium]|nr:hypothetical protein [Bryobacteraceae bacterium]